MVHDPKPPFHSHNSLSFGKFQDTERFLIHCERHFSSRLPPIGGTCKYTKAPSTKKTWRDSVPIDMLLPAVSVLVVAQSSSEIPERLRNNPVFSKPELEGKNDRPQEPTALSCGRGVHRIKLRSRAEQGGIEKHPTSCQKSHPGRPVQNV